MRGRADAEKRHHQNAIVEARWAGLFAQAGPKDHPRILKAALRDEKPPRAMGGREIGGIMRAWAIATRKE